MKFLSPYKPAPEDPDSLKNPLNCGDPIAWLPLNEAGQLHFEQHRVNDRGGYLALPNDFVNCNRRRRQTGGDGAAGGIEAIARVVAQPSGVWNDGPSSIYERFDVTPGRHVISVRMRDTARETGWDYSRTDTVDLVAGRYFTVTFKAENGGFQFR